MRRHKADREQKCQNRAATPDAYRAANLLRMTARRALEGLECSKACLLFKYRLILLPWNK